MKRTTALCLSISSAAILLAACRDVGSGPRLTSTVQLTATLRDSAGNLLKDRAVLWLSDDATLATVSATGLVAGAAEGSAIITATTCGLRRAVQMGWT